MRFAEFVVAGQPALLRLAVVLCGQLLPPIGDAAPHRRERRSMRPRPRPADRTPP